MLFLTNMGAILLAGTVTFMFTGLAAVGRRPAQIRNALFAIVAFVALIAIPLRANSHLIWQDATREDEVLSIVEDWLPSTEWEIYSVNVEDDEVQILVGGDGPLPPADEAIAEINAVFDGDMELTARIVPVRTEVIAGTPAGDP